MVTIGDLIKQGIIKEYIPPQRGGNSERVKKPVLQDLFPDVFRAWIRCDIAKNRRAGKSQDTS